MNLIDRVRSAWLSFLDPEAYWEGVSIRNIARQITDRGGMAILEPDSQVGYVVKALPYQDQQAIQRYLGNL